MIKTTAFLPSRIGCPSIPGTVKGIIVSIPGVQDVKIHYEERSVDVTFDDEKVSEGDISKKIGEEMGLAFTAGSRDAGSSHHAADSCPM